MNFRPGVSFLPMLQKPVNLPCLATGFRRRWSIWVVPGSRIIETLYMAKVSCIIERFFVWIDDIGRYMTAESRDAQVLAMHPVFFRYTRLKLALGDFLNIIWSLKIGCFEPQPTAVNWWLTCRSGLGTHPHHCKLWINIGYLNQIFFWYHLLYMYTPYIWVNVNISPFAVYFMSFWRKFSRSPYHLCSFFSLHILRFTEGIDVLLWTAMQTCNNDDNDT